MSPDDRDDPDDIAYLRQRAAEERSAADDAACMARTAHADMADDYADRADTLAEAAAAGQAELEALLGRID